MLTFSELALVTAALCSSASGYFVSVDAHAEECFYERVNSGTKMGLMFEVAEGGFLDIDVEVKNNNNTKTHAAFALKIKRCGVIECLWSGFTFTLISVTLTWCRLRSKPFSRTL